MKKDDMLVLILLFINCNILNHLLGCYYNRTISQLISFGEFIWEKPININNRDN